MSNTLVEAPQFFAPAPFDPVTVEFTANIDNDLELEKVQITANFNQDGSLKSKSMIDANTGETIYGILNGTLDVTAKNGTLSAVYHYPNSKKTAVAQPVVYEKPTAYGPGNGDPTPQQHKSDRPTEGAAKRDEPVFDWPHKHGENKGRKAI
jgi:hypothetical protein